MAAPQQQPQQQQRRAQPSDKGGASRRTSDSRPAPPRRRQRQRTSTTGSSSSPAAAAAPPPQLSVQELLAWERAGFHVSRQLLPPDTLQPVLASVQHVTQASRLESLKHRVRVLCPPALAARVSSATSTDQVLSLLAQLSEQVGFLQFFNLHRSQPAVAALVRDPRLAGTAAQLLGAKRLRLYQDCVFLKEPGMADTQWHSDLRMAPLDTNSFVTAWVPLRPIRGGQRDSGLVFAAGSHRDFALPFWHDLSKPHSLEGRGYELADAGAMALGDVSFHHGWLVHAGGPQPPNSPPRLALAVSYFADGARVLARRSDPSVRAGMLHDEDAESYAPWLKDIRDGARARHALLPLVL